MRIIQGSRCSGRTTKLIRISAKGKYVIVCHDVAETQRIPKYAQEKMGKDIPTPITYEAFLTGKYHGRQIKGFLIDNIDYFLKSISPHIPIEVCTVEGREKKTYWWCG